MLRFKRRASYEDYNNLQSDWEAGPTADPDDIKYPEQLARDARPLEDRRNDFIRELNQLDHSAGSPDFARDFKKGRSLLSYTTDQREECLDHHVEAFNNVQYFNQNERWQAALAFAQDTCQPLYYKVSDKEEKQLFETDPQFMNDPKLQMLLATEEFKNHQISCTQMGVDANGDPIRHYQATFKDTKTSQQFRTAYSRSQGEDETRGIEKLHQAYAAQLFNSHRDPKQAAHNLNTLLHHHTANGHIPAGIDESLRSLLGDFRHAQGNAESIRSDPGLLPAYAIDSFRRMNRAIPACQLLATPREDLRDDCKCQSIELLEQEDHLVSQGYTQQQPADLPQAPQTPTPAGGPPPTIGHRKATPPDPPDKGM